MERTEWICTSCRELNYGFICEYVGKKCKNCGRTIYLNGDIPVESCNRKV